MDKKIYTLGKMFALLNYCHIMRTKRDLTPDLFMGAPCARYGEYMSKTHFIAEKPLMQRMQELVEDIDDIPKKPLSVEEQGSFFLGFYHETNRCRDVFGPPENKRNFRSGRPVAGAGIDWKKADWSLSDADIARELGCSPQAVWAKRRKIERMEKEKNRL